MRSAAFDEVFETHKEAVFRFLYRVSGHAADAEDLMQETFLVYWNKRGQFRGDGRLIGYLRRTGFRLYLNLREKRKRRRALAHAGPTPTTEVDSDVGRIAHDESVRFLVARVRESLDGLPDGAREAFLLFRFEGMTCAEIADAMGTPLKTVESRLRRATQLLAERLQRFGHHMPTG